MKIEKIKELQKGKLMNLELLVLDVTEKLTSKNDPYLIVTATDGDEKADIRFWNTELDDFTESWKNHVMSINLKCDMYNGTASYVGTDAMFSNKPVTDFVQKVPEECSEMFQYLRNFPFKNRDIKLLVNSILDENEEKLLYWAAAKSMHHALYGGLLYHMYRMTQASASFNHVYGIDHDMIAAGAILHDIGKIQELDTDELGNASYTVDGRLFGHMYLGMQMIQDAAKALNTPPEIVRHLCHILASHHGKPEYGSFVPPATKEAEVVHMLDLADSRIYQYEEAYKTLEDGETSDFLRGLNHSIVKL